MVGGNRTLSIGSLPVIKLTHQDKRIAYYSKLVDIAYFSGWSIHKGIVFLQWDESVTWYTEQVDTRWRGLGIKAPHWLARRLVELGTITQDEVTRLQAKYFGDEA